MKTIRITLWLALAIFFLVTIPLVHLVDNIFSERTTYRKLFGIWLGIFSSHTPWG